MYYDYDVLVVGARVAGSATAMLLARQGHRVLLVDRVTMPADTVSTHAILRTGVLQLRRWGILDSVVAGAPPIRDVVLGFGHERVSFEMRGDYGIDALYAPRRYVLDTELVRAAVEAGVEFAGATRMIGLRRDSRGRVCGATVSGGLGSTNVSARFVVGADGQNSRVAREVRAHPYLAHRPQNAVHYGYYDGIETSGFRFQFTPGVNAGLIPTNDGATCVFVGRPARRISAFRSDPDAEFRHLLSAAATDLAELVGAGKRMSPYRGTSGLPGFLRKPWGAGWALVGDSGYLKDPISAHGISDALRDAELCARALDRALHTPDSEDEALTHYHTQRDAFSMRIYEESKALSSYRWDSAEASERMKTISGAVRRECDAIVNLPQWENTPMTATG